MGSCDSNLFLNTLTYDVEFSDGEIKECLANVLTDNMHAQADKDGHSIQILDAIVDYRKDSNAVDKAYMLLRTKSGQ